MREGEAVYAFLVIRRTVTIITRGIIHVKMGEAGAVCLARMEENLFRVRPDSGIKAICLEGHVTNLEV